MNVVDVIIDGIYHTLKVGEVMPESRGHLIVEMYPEFDNLIIRTNPPPAQGQHYELPLTAIVK